MAQSMNTASTGVSARASNGNGNGFGRAVVALFDTVAEWNERRRQRRALQALPDYLLHDIGVSRTDAAQEAEKPFWRG
jgi:Uncharacterized conserved small protein